MSKGSNRTVYALSKVNQDAQNSQYEDDGADYQCHLSDVLVFEVF